MNVDIDGGYSLFKTDIDGTRIAIELSNGYNSFSGTMTIEETEQVIEMLHIQLQAARSNQ